MKTINLVMIFLLVIMLWMRWFGEGGAIDYKNKLKQLEKQKTINKELVIRNEKLRAEVNNLRNGLEAIEERARAEMGMIKSDETFIQIIDDNQ